MRGELRHALVQIAQKAPEFDFDRFPWPRTDRQLEFGEDPGGSHHGFRGDLKQHDAALPANQVGERQKMVFEIPVGNELRHVRGQTPQNGSAQYQDQEQVHH